LSLSPVDFKRHKLEEQEGKKKQREREKKREKNNRKHLRALASATRERDCFLLSFLSK